MYESVNKNSLISGSPTKQRIWKIHSYKLLSKKSDIEKKQKRKNDDANLKGLKDPEGEYAVKNKTHTDDHTETWSEIVLLSNKIFVKPMGTENSSKRVTTLSTEYDPTQAMKAS